MTQVEKYYVKLLLFVFDVALTNSWIIIIWLMIKRQQIIQLEQIFLSLATELLQIDIDWAAKYQLMEQCGTCQITSDNPNNNNYGDGDNGNDSDNIIDNILPAGTTLNESERKIMFNFS